MDNFESAIQNYRESRGSIAQEMLQGTVGQIESQQQLIGTKAQILSAADNADQETNVSVNMSNTLDKLGLDFGVKEIGAKFLPWVSKKIAGQVVDLNTARAAREADRIGARANNARLPDTQNPASGDGTAVNGGRGLGQDAGGVTQPSIGPRPAPTNPGKAPARSGEPELDTSTDASGASQDINIAARGDATAAGDTSLGDAFAALRGALPGDLGRVAATTSERIGLFSNQAAKLARGVKLGSGFDVNNPGRISFSTPRQPRIPDIDTSDPFSNPAGGRSISSSFTPEAPTSAPAVTVPSSRPTTLGTRDLGADDAAAAARRAAAAASETAESTLGSDALSFAGRTIGVLADVLGPAAAIYGIIEAGHGLYEDAKLQSDDAFKQANTLIGRAQIQQNNLSSDISADQFASKIGASMPSFGSLAAPSMDTSQMMGGGSVQF